MAGFRDAGFTAALVVPQGGIYRGQSVLIALRDTSTEEMVLRDNVTQAVGFATGGFGRGYPSSSMGVMALDPPGPARYATPGDLGGQLQQRPDRDSAA